MSANGNPNAPDQPSISWVDTAGLTHLFSFDLVKSETWNDDATVTEHAVEVGANVGDHIRVELEKCELEILSTPTPLDGNAFQTAVLTGSSAQLPVPSWVKGSGLLVVPAWQNNIEIRALAGALVGLGGGLKGTLGQVGGLAGDLLLGALFPGVETQRPVQTTAGLSPPAPSRIVTPTVQMFAAPSDFVEATHAQMKALKDAGQLLSVYGTKQVNLSMAIEKLTFVRNASTGGAEMMTVGFKEVRVVATQMVPVPIQNLSAGGGAPPVHHGAQNASDAPPAMQKSTAAYIVDSVGGVKGAVEKVSAFFGWGASS
ncbi:MAG TPA: hypothetical protein VGL81_09140 [Polyangiaceae bacterium]